jgi:hypothetical protein
MAHAVAADPAGHAYVTGWTLSADFPVTPGAFDTTHNRTRDAFVVKLDASGTGLVYSTFLGGRWPDYGRDVAVDSSGHAYVTGRTDSGDFPATAGAFDTTFNGATDIFVVKVGPSGDALEYATFLGGGDFEEASGIAEGPSGSAIVSGHSMSPDFPVTAGAHDPSYNGSTDVIVAKIGPGGSDLSYATYIGGGAYERAESVAVDPSGSAWVTGSTSSLDFPVTPGALDPTHNGDVDAYAVKVAPSGGDLEYSTFLGGSSNDRAWAIAVNASGVACLTGSTQSDDFPVTADALSLSMAGPQDAFVLLLDATASGGAGLVHSTFLGGDYREGGRDLVLDDAGHAFVAGETWSPGFPTTPGAFDTSHNGESDCFLAHLDLRAAVLVESTFLGGSDRESPYGIALASVGEVLLAGETSSPDFPASAWALDPSHNGGADAFVARFRMAGGSPAGDPCPRSQGYWKSHPGDWPILTLDLGVETYTQAELMDLLETPTRGDASRILARQLIAARLNIENGSDPAPVSAAVADADALLDVFTGKMPYGVHASTATGQRMVALGTVLDDYNSRVLTPGCAP